MAKHAAREDKKVQYNVNDISPLMIQISVLRQTLFLVTVIIIQTKGKNILK